MEKKIEKPKSKVNTEKKKVENEFEGMSTDEIHHEMQESEIAYKQYLEMKMKGVL